MSARLLLLCPGQGGQHPAMFALARQHPAGAALLDAMAPLLPPEDADWHANRHAQPLVVAATLAMWAALEGRVPAPALVAGYSIGELAAWSVAGALDPGQAVMLAARRAALMDMCVVAAAGAPATVMPLPASMPAQAWSPESKSSPREDTAQVRMLMTDAAPSDTRTPAPPGLVAGTVPPGSGHAMLAFTGLPVALATATAAPYGGWLAIRNGDDSGVIGLPAAPAPALQEQFAALGGKVTRLPVAVAAHTPYMADAVAPFEQALAGAPLRDAQCPVLSGTSAERLSLRAQALAHLPRQVAQTIDWDDCMDACDEAGVTVALELGPGNALARMMQARHPHIACRSVADFRSVDGVVRWLERH